jgi:serine/threonine protein kinase
MNPRSAVRRRIGEYRLEEVLGEGATGTVYRAVRDSDGTLVALKALKAELVRDQIFRRRFEHEARAAAEVRHKNLIPVLTSGREEDLCYLVMRYVESRSLADITETDGPQSLGEVVRLGAGLGSGLDALHDAGLVHRDVKPSNILIDARGRALLTDFGLAKGRAYTALTRPGQALGTLDYMAPELVRGEPATPSSDIYALGCVIFECLTGAPPFAERSFFEVGTAHVEEEPPDPRGARNDLPQGFAWAVLTALAKDPQRRPTTATMYAYMLRLATRT